MLYLLLIVWLVFSAEILDINKCKTKFVYEGQRTPFFYLNEFKFRRKVFLVLLFFFASLIMGLRDLSVGIDTEEYRNMYIYVSGKGWGEIFATHGIFGGIEIGFAVAIKLCSEIFDNYYYFQFLCSTIFCLCVAVFLYSDTKDIEMSAIVFFGIGFYLLAFNVMRQLVAAMYVMNAWKLLKKGKNNWAVLLYFLAVITHFTSMFLCVIYVVERLCKHKKFLTVFPFVLFVGIMILKPFIMVVIDLFPKYAAYLQMGSMVKPGLVFFVWLIVALLSLGVLYHKTEYNTDEKSVAVYSLLYVASFILGISIPLFERFGYYFTPFVFLLIPMSSRMFKEIKLDGLYSLGVKCCFFLYYAVDVFAREPYLTYMFNSFK